jgi:hypothetical protein
MSSKSLGLSHGPSKLSNESPLDEDDSLNGVRSEQIVEFVFDCMMSNNDVAYDDIDNDSIEIARRRRSVDRAVKKRRATAESVKKKLRELQADIDTYEKIGAPIDTQRHLNAPLSHPVGMQVSLCSN